ncbi:DUF1697 domain-containing protein [Dermatobacter hominis]|uniref:DUF1697 domain-containing protein n=1 Tax=Dermatobacter hominis TaxID=2884263 RepID=UPI001D115E38|nr:DUF1697 domain-containing protein [Dermatobacter hominis]UDY37558.1 DUF1697 domain-containing protein [Dermatobacter hominis]
MQHVALLRGIGPGNPKMRNEVLVGVLERAGLDDVRAVISSGNYVFRSVDDRAALERRIEAALRDHLGSRCSTIVRSRRQIDGIAALPVFDGHDDGPTARCNVTFLKRRPPTGHRLPSAGDGFEVLAVERQAVFFLVDASRSRTPEVMALMERTFGTGITTRTWRTVHRIAAAFERAG